MTKNKKVERKHFIVCSTRLQVFTAVIRN